MEKQDFSNKWGVTDKKETSTGSLIEVGKIFVDRQGAGRLYVPKRIVTQLNLENKDHMKLEANDISLTATAIKKL